MAVQAMHSLLDSVALSTQFACEAWPKQTGNVLGISPVCISSLVYAFGQLRGPRRLTVGVTKRLIVRVSKTGSQVVNRSTITCMGQGPEGLDGRNPRLTNKRAFHNTRCCWLEGSITFCHYLRGFQGPVFPLRNPRTGIFMQLPKWSARPLTACLSKLSAVGAICSPRLPNTGPFLPGLSEPAQVYKFTSTPKGKQSCRKQSKAQLFEHTRSSVCSIKSLFVAHL